MLIGIMRIITAVMLMETTERRIIVREGRRYSVLSPSEAEAMLHEQPWLVVRIGGEWCLDEDMAEFADEAVGF